MSHEEVETTTTPVADPVGDQFSGLLATLATFRSQITALQQQLRGLEKTVKRDLKHAKKEALKNKHKGNRKPSGFAKPTKISAQLCQFMAKDEGSEVARTEVTQFVIKYISEHKLQNPDNRKIIQPDQELATLLGTSEEDEVTYFNLQKYMNRHFHKKGGKGQDPSAEATV